MNRIVTLACFAAAICQAQETALTLHNQNFAVVRNRNTVVIRVVEHLYRAFGWEVSASSGTYLKTDSSTVEFRVQVAPGGEQTITYTVHYTW